MLDKYRATNRQDQNMNPTGGTVEGEGLQIRWQDGHLGRGKDRMPPNGAFVETVIDAARQRLEFYQNSKFAHELNRSAIWHLEVALDCLRMRTEDREKRQVEGEHKI